MVKTEMYKRNDGALLVIYKCVNDDLIGEVYANGVAKRGKWDMRARFCAKDKENTSYRVCEYFGFPYTAFWKRWA